MKIVVTGAAGFVGSYLSQYLIKQGHELLLIDNYSVPSNLTRIENVRIHNMDIRDKLDISHYDVVIHLAAVTGINQCQKDKKEAWSVNVGGTYNLLRSFHGKVIFASTSAVYGICQAPEIDEGHPVEPRNFYGITKLEGEGEVKIKNGFTILRFSNIYGKGLSCKRTVADIFIEHALDGKDIEIHGDGKQRRDFVHINDVVRAYWQALNSNTNTVYNIGGNEALSINDIAELVRKHYRRIFGYDLKIMHTPTESGMKWKDFIYISDKAKTLLNYEPIYSIGDEISNRMNAAKKTGGQNA